MPWGARRAWLALARLPKPVLGGLAAAGGLAGAWGLVAAASPRPVPAGIAVYGAVTGATYSLLAVALILVYRANRVINFAGVEVGVLGAVLFENLMRASGWPWPAAAVVGVGAASACSLGLERLVAQRFFRSPRLVLAVVTIGLAQLVAFGEYLVGQGFGTFAAQAGLRTPLSGLHVDLSGVVLDGNAALLLAAPGVVVGLVWVFLRRTDLGTATRAAAESSARASALGVPVRAVSTLSWALAGAVAGLAVVLRSPVVGLVSGASLAGPSLLLRALTAAVLARFESLGVAVAAGLAIGVVEQGLFYAYGGSTVSDAVFVAVIVLAFLLQRPPAGRPEEAEETSWSLVGEERPLPAWLARRPPIRLGRAAGALVLAGLVLGLPTLLSDSQLFLASEVVIYAVMAVSLVVLTGWAGHVSLGQLGLAALGAAVAGRLSADAGADFLLSMLAAGLAGAAAATLLGVAALRIKGFFFAVTSLGFAVAVDTFFLNSQFFSFLLPANRPERPVLFERFDLSGELAFYLFCLAVLALVVAGVATLRRSRTGRVLIAVRDNDAAARSFGISRARTQLLAFAISGFIAGLGGSLFVVHDHAVSPSAFSPAASLALFSMVVVGGLGSLSGAIAGTVVVESAVYLLPPQWSPVATGAGLVGVLLVMPGGLGRAGFLARDRLVAWLARRHGWAEPTPAQPAGLAAAAGVPG